MNAPEQAYASRSACITLTLLLLVVLSIELINATAWALNHITNTITLSSVAMLIALGVILPLIAKIPWLQDEISSIIKCTLWLGPLILPPRWRRYALTTNVTTILLSIFTLKGLFLLYQIPDWMLLTIGGSLFLLLGILFWYQARKENTETRHPQSSPDSSM